MTRTSRTSHTQIVVGIDGGPGGLRAAEYAAMLAREHNLTVRLVHAYHLIGVATPAMVPIESADTLRAFGQNALRAATRRVKDAAPLTEVDSTLVMGSAPAALINASKSAALVVVGRNPTHGLERMLTGSTSTPVAARAHAPVVSVPAQWSHSNDTARVVVGTDGSTQGRAALAFAFDEATRRGSTLTVVRVWAVPPSWAVDVAHRPSEQEWREDAEIALAEDLAGYSEQYPDVAVTRIVERSSATARVLLDHGADASLLVIGARGHGGVPGLDMGMVARNVLAHAGVPVAVVHRADVEHEPMRPATTRHVAVAKN
ncbi:MAG TPA: universal stress protein [Nocardioidaceae bacterium]|nr:universal stress protein [Nocardioidaceae bacterium]